jgi:hypothetical protein
MSLRRACRLALISRTLYAYCSQRPGQETLRLRLPGLSCASTQILRVTAGVKSTQIAGLKLPAWTDGDRLATYPMRVRAFPNRSKAFHLLTVC